VARREAVTITFVVVAASGAVIGGIGAAFWALLAGLGRTRVASPSGDGKLVSDTEDGLTASADLADEGTQP
jgi:hypothetical protein